MNEPTRKSYLDLMKNNLAAAERDQFITRLVYFGSYHGSDEYLQTKFATVVHHLRSEYSDVVTTGLLLVYPKYFVHIIETSEELILRHLNAIFYHKEMSINLGRVLPLPPHHHVYHVRKKLAIFIIRRFFPSWLKVFTKPPELFEKLEGSGTEEVEKQLTDCLSKVDTLCEYISTTAKGSIKATEEVLQSLRDRDQRYLPESTIIEFLLNAKSPILRDIREYVDIAPSVPYIRLYNEIIWPPTCDFMPNEIFVEHVSRRDLMLKRLSQQQQLQRQK